MTNSQICKYINSKDIRKYLMDINYEFSALEASWLVSHCANLSLKERWAAWEDIINTMPDQSVESFHFREPYESLHCVLRKHISLQKDLLDSFKKEESGAFYQFKITEAGFRADYDGSIAYSSYEKCYDEMATEIKEYNDDDLAFEAEIRRLVVDQRRNAIEVEYSKSGEITAISTNRDMSPKDFQIYDFFELIWLCFPAPFKVGDIIYNPYRPLPVGSDPVVMTGMTPMYYAKNGKKLCDTSDMNVDGYFQDEETGTIYHEVTWNYMDFEYYPAELLTGKKRILKALSNYLKEQIDIELFIKAYHLIILEETKNDLTPRGWYTDDGLILAGLQEQ